MKPIKLIAENPVLFEKLSTNLLDFACFACIFMMIFGFFGNLITIAALINCKKVSEANRESSRQGFQTRLINVFPQIRKKNATALFIINLSFSDLLFCCFNLPLAASIFYHRKWSHGMLHKCIHSGSNILSYFLGDLLCQLFPLLRYGLLAVSLFTILAITFNRFVFLRQV